MADVICSGKGTVRVNGGELPLEQVRQRFLELRRRHIEHVLSTLESNPISVRNPRAYLITLLYNAPLTVCDFQPRPAPQSRKPEVSKSSFDIDDVMREIKERYRKCAGRG